MALFEHVVLLKQDLSSSDLESEIKNHEEIISEFYDGFYVLLQNCNSDLRRRNCQDSSNQHSVPREDRNSLSYSSNPVRAMASDNCVSFS